MNTCKIICIIIKGLYKLNSDNYFVNSLKNFLFDKGIIGVDQFLVPIKAQKMEKFELLIDNTLNIIKKGSDLEKFNFNDLQVNRKKLLTDEEKKHFLM